MNKIYSRKLDDQAKVFALASNKKYSSIFRLSVKLKEEIDGDILQKAVELALEKFKAFKVRMKKGIFWYYLIENEMQPIVTKADENLFKKIHTKRNNKYLFKVTYIEEKINIEIFHALTDGNGGAQFFKEIIYKYLELKYPENLEFTELDENMIVSDCENAYVKNYKKNVKKTFKAKRAYKLQGQQVNKGNIELSHYNINLPEIKKCTRDMNCSLSMYLVAMIAYAIYEGNYKSNKSKRPVNLCVPINLQKYFNSKTLSNFFSYMIITLKFKRNNEYSFENILDMIKKEFDRKLRLERIIETMSTDAGMTRNLFIRAIPLFIKKIAVRIGSLRVKRHFTMTISNIGKFDINDKYSNYIENAFIMLSPDWAEKMKCGICSYKDNLIVSFGTILKDNLIEEKFQDLLIKNNIKFDFESTKVKALQA